MNTSLQFEMPKSLKNVSFALLGLGLVLGIVTFVLYADDPTRVWTSLLVNNFFFLALGIGGAVLTAIFYISHSGWNTVMKRILEAMSMYMPVGLIVMLVIGLVGMPYLYEWSYQEAVDQDKILQSKDWFLNKPTYLILTLFALVVWTGLIYWMRKNSIAEDREGGVKRFWKNYKISAGFMVVWGFSFCFAVFIWLMSLEPHWYSTIYAVYVFASILVLSFTFTNMAGIYLKGKGFLPWFNNNHMHDTSKFIFAFSIFWGYIFVSQLLLIWYANIPEETPYYLLRWGELDGELNFKALFYINIVLNFLTPFLVFMTRDSKRQVRIVLLVAFFMIIAKWIDFYLLIVPGAVKGINHLAHLGIVDYHSHVGFGIPEIGFFLFFAGLFLLVVGTALSKAKIIPRHHPYLLESLRHHV